MNVTTTRGVAVTWVALTWGCLWTGGSCYQVLPPTLSAWGGTWPIGDSAGHYPPCAGQDEQTPNEYKWAEHRRFFSLLCKVTSEGTPAFGPYCFSALWTDVSSGRAEWSRINYSRGTTLTREETELPRVEGLTEVQWYSSMSSDITLSFSMILLSFVLYFCQILE